MGSLHILTIVNNAAMNIFRISVLGFFRCTPISGITGSYGSSIFNVLSSLHTVENLCLRSMPLRESLCSHPAYRSKLNAIQADFALRQRAGAGAASHRSFIDLFPF